MALFNSFTHISTGWARPEINDTKTPNWFIICLLILLYNKFAGIFVLKVKNLHCFQRYIVHLPTAQQISLELNFCVELHTEKNPDTHTAY